MQICRFTLKNDLAAAPRVGLMSPEGVRDVTAATEHLPALRWPLPPGDQFVANLDALRPRMEALAATAPLHAREDLHLLSPIANPGKFICGVGNWPQHGFTFGSLGYLFKMTSAAGGEGDGVQLRWPYRTTLHEAELAFVVARTCTNVREEDALDYVAGYMAALDITLKEEREFFSFCKSFDTYGVLGPCLVTADEIADPAQLAYRFSLNGEFVHGRSFGELVGGVAKMLSFASSVMTLHPGDVIFSGTSEVGPIVPGDVMTIDIPGVGRMDVPVSVSPHARRD